MEQHEPNCAYCSRLPNGYVSDRDSLDAFPETWRPLAGHPRVHAAPWLESGRGSRWVFCEACQAIWFLFFNPKDLYYSDLVLVPESFWPVLDAGSQLDEVLAAILDPPRVTGGRFFEGWVLRWLRRAEFDHAKALEWLTVEMERDALSAQGAQRLVRYASAVIDCPDAAERVREVDFGPLARLSGRADIFESLDSRDREWAEKKLREALASLSEAAIRRGINLGHDVEFRLRAATSPSRLVGRAVGRLLEALDQDDDARLAEVMHSEFLAVKDGLEDVDDTVDIQSVQPILTALSRLRESDAPSNNPHSPTTRALTRYDNLLEDIVARGKVARGDVVEVLEAFAPHRVSYFRPDRFDTPAASDTAGCRACRRQTRPGKVTRFPQFPEPWSHIHQTPGLTPGGWVATMQPEWVHSCARCNSFWYTFVSPDGTSYLHEALPETCKTAFDARTTADEMVEFVTSGVYATHRLEALRRVCWRYFEQSYGPKDGAKPLFDALATDTLSDAQRLDLLTFTDLTIRVLVSWQANYPGKSIELPEHWRSVLDKLAWFDWSRTAADARAQALSSSIRHLAHHIVG